MRKKNFGLKFTPGYAVGKLHGPGAYVGSASDLILVSGGKGVIYPSGSRG